MAPVESSFALISSRLDRDLGCPRGAEGGVEVAPRILTALRRLRRSAEEVQGSRVFGLFDQTIADRLAIRRARDCAGDCAPHLPVCQDGDCAELARSEYFPPRALADLLREAAALIDRLVDALGGAPDADEVVSDIAGRRLQ